MSKLSVKAKVTISVIVVLAVLAVMLVTLPFVIYLKILPDAVSNIKVQNYVAKTLKDSMGVDLVLKNPVLKTEFSPQISFSVDDLELLKDKQTLLTIKKLDTVLSFEKVMQERLIIRKIGLDYFFADVNKLTELAQPAGKEQQPNNWAVEWFDSLMYIKKCLIVYKAAPDTYVTVIGKDMEITKSREPKFVKFDLAIDVRKNKDNIRLALNAEDNVYIKNKKLFIDDCTLKINNSNVKIKSISDEKNNFDLTVFSNKFDVKNVVELINTNFVIPNGSEMLAFFKDIKGDFDFKINMSNSKKGSKMRGDVKLNKLTLSVVPLNNLPMTLTSGVVDITENNIYLKDFKGFYSNKKADNLNFSGTVRDYMKSCETNIEAHAVATNDFTKNYLSKIVGYPIELVGTAPAKMTFKSIYNKIDMIWAFKINKGDDLLVDGASFSPTGWDRAVQADLHFEDNMLDIKSINYYIASEIKKGVKVKPLLSIYGNVDLANIEKTGMPDMKKLGFEIPKPLPSEFLNVLVGQKVFKKGTISGKLEVINEGKVPVLNGSLAMEKVRIPSQRLFVKEGKLTTDSKSIKLSADGRYKRSAYNLTGSILNELALPIIVKDINLTVDSIDIEKLMNSFNNQPATVQAGEPATADAMLISAKADDNEEDVDAPTFNAGVLIVENCVLNLVKGVYKDINFGNLKATLTLNKDGILEVKSNRFDFAEGISSCKVYCDLQKHLYSVKLGVKDINSDLIASTLLELKREITGKASGIIHINTDDTLRLNGSMKFIVKDGTIAKVGLVEYALKFASLFRNPMAMISPSTIVDLVNVPEGKFNKIVGDLQIKDNVIEKIMIKSSAPQLSSFIIGRFDLESRDATLRIYTKFSNKNKGFAGFMRNISLNSLANRVPLSSRNDSLYYSAELEQLPAIEADEKDCQVFLTKVDGDVEHFNFISSLKKIK